MDAVDQFGNPLDSGADRNAVVNQHDQLGPPVAHFVRHVERPVRESDRLERRSSEYLPYPVVEFRAGLAGIDMAFLAANELARIGFGEKPHRRAGPPGLLVRAPLHAERGWLSTARRDGFSELQDAEIEAMEAAVLEAMRE